VAAASIGGIDIVNIFSREYKGSDKYEVGNG
jgi:hypothetical protein